MKNELWITTTFCPKAVTHTTVVRNSRDTLKTEKSVKSTTRSDFPMGGLSICSTSTTESWSMLIKRRPSFHRQKTTKVSIMRSWTVTTALDTSIKMRNYYKLRQKGSRRSEEH